MANQISLRIRRTEEKEKKGSHGAWRGAFCREYSASLVETRENTFRSLLESLAREGGEISCRKGCSWCCYHYVSVSLAQGMVIVDYLYRRKDLLKQFLDRFEEWRERAESLADDIDRIRNQAMAASTPISRVIEETRPLSTRYFESNIRCPFLVDDVCSIYSVRPLACSGHHSVSPPDRCAPGSEQKPDIRRVTPDDRDLVGMMQLADPRLTLYELTLPTMIHQLLTEGSAAMMSDLSQFAVELQ